MTNTTKEERCPKCQKNLRKWFDHQEFTGWHCSNCGFDIPPTQDDHQQKGWELKLLDDLNIPLCDGNHSRMGCERERALFLISQARLSALQEAQEDVEETKSMLNRSDFQQGLGCGLEDRGITDRYEAMNYGIEQTFEIIGEALSLSRQKIEELKTIK